MVVGVGTRVARGGCGRMVLLVAVGMAKFVYMLGAIPDRTKYP